MSASAPTSPPSTNTTSPPSANATSPPSANTTSPPSANTTSPPSANTTPPASTPAATPPSSNLTSPPPPATVAPPPSNPASPPPTDAAQAPSAQSNSSAPPSGTPSGPILPVSPPSSNFSTPPPPSTPNASVPVSSTTRSPPPPPSSRSPPPPPSSSTRSSTSSPPPPPVASDSSSSSLSSGAVVGIVIAGFAVLVVMLLLILCCMRKRRRSDGSAYHDYPPSRKDDGYQVRWHQNGPPSDHVGGGAPKPTPPSMQYGSAQHTHRMSSGGSEYPSYDGHFPPPSPGMPLGFSNSTYTFSYDELARATDGFSKANLLGQGGFGYVHKGVLSDGKEVAIKQLKAGSGQGDREFQAEIEIISRVHHRHLVSLVGYCITGSQRLLVYEFVPNNTLEFHLHGKMRQTMKWDTRHKIALGSAKGLAYLHEDCNPKIIHRDIKAANILLDFKFEAKVADFGLAKFTSDANTHVSTRVMGTFGYLAPEYASSGKLSEKSDVFSFGVMLLELITGRRPVDATQAYLDDSLVDWARPLLEQFVVQKEVPNLVDPELQDEYDLHEMVKMISCASVCTQHSAKKRPSMSQVVRALEGDASMSEFEQITKQGHRFPSSHGSSDYDTIQYNADMIKFRKMALESQEYGASSEYSAPTSENGLFGTGSSSEDAHTREIEARNFRKHIPRSGGRQEF